MATAPSQTNTGLFADDAPRPLADRLRPAALTDIVGQDHLVGEEGTLIRLLHGDQLPSLIFWGPPGCGKTSIARLIAGHTDLEFEPLSAVFSGVADLRKVFDRARQRRDAGRGTLLFVDEIHRFNRAQQDAFLPYVEEGLVTLVGATTENPSFELNAALLSRCHVLVLKRLESAALGLLLQRAEAIIGTKLPVDEQARETLIAMADGDGRYLINLVEQIKGLDQTLDTAGLMERLQKRAPIYDKGQESHYNLISALHKSVRGSDADAALYWLARMFAGGEDPHYVARRMVRMAVEDIGLADPQAAGVTLEAWQIYERLGSPEGELALAQAIIYLATAPKSNAAYSAFKSAVRSAKETGSLNPPAHILNAPTKLMKEIGYGAGYAYDHDQADGFSGQNYFPDGMPRQQFYQPVERGFEREINKRLNYWNRLRQQRSGGTDTGSDTE